MAKNKGIYRIFRTKEDMQHHDEEIRHFTRVFTLDHVTVALGRMGFRESNSGSSIGFSRRFSGST